MSELFHEKSVHIEHPSFLVLTDLDDTQVNTKLYDHHVDLALSHGRIQTNEEVETYRQKVREVMGGPGNRVIAELYPDEPPEIQRMLLDEFRRLVKNDPKPTRPIAGASEMLETFYQRQIPVGMLTNRSSGLDQALYHANLQPYYFTHVYDNVGERYSSKLQPAEILMARYALSGSNVIMFGDSIRDDIEPFLELPEEQRPKLAFIPKPILQEQDAQEQMAEARSLGALAFRHMAECKEEWAVDYTR